MSYVSMTGSNFLTLNLIFYVKRSCCKRKLHYFSKNRKVVQRKILRSSNFFEPIDGKSSSENSNICNNKLKGSNTILKNEAKLLRKQLKSERRKLESQNKTNFNLQIKKTILEEKERNTKS